MGKHSDAQKELAAAFEAVFLRPATVNERLFLGAIALGESGYSRAVYRNKVTGESKVLNNWGAIQCPSPIRPCPPGSFEVSDYDVLPDGSHKPFNQCYCDDATRADAAIRFVTTLYKKRPHLLAAASEVPPHAYEELMALTGVNRVEDPAPLYGSKVKPTPMVDLANPYYLHIAWFSHVMRDSKYFGLELRYHIGAQIRFHDDIAAETGERIDGGPGAMPSPKEPAPEPEFSQLEWLSLLALSLSEDAAKRRYLLVPPKTTETLRKFQRAHDLLDDGIPGKLTLKALFKLPI